MSKRRAREADNARPRSIYIYALLDTVPAARLKGTRIEIVEAGGLFAAVEPRQRPPRISERWLRRQHDIVVRLAAVADAILPVRFGTLVQASELDALIAPRARALRGALKKVRGRVQMTVRFYGKRVEPPQVEKPTTGREYLRQRAQQTRPVLPAAARALCAAVHPVIEQEIVEPGRVDVAVSVHHLVRRERVVKYLERIEAALTQCHPVPTLSISGPWPPFAFTRDIWSNDVR